MQWHALAVALSAILLASCGGNDGSFPTTTEVPNTVAARELPQAASSLPVCSRFPRLCDGVSGTVTGLRTAGLVLSSGLERISIKSNQELFRFSMSRLPGRLADVRIVQNPSWQRCKVRVDRGDYAFGRDDTYSISCEMLSSRVTTIAGTGEPGNVDGPASSAQFNLPTGVAVDAAGNLFVTDRQSGSIRKIAQDGSVSTFVGLGFPRDVDGVGTAAGFRYPEGIGIGSDGTMYVSSGDSLVRKVTPGAVVTTLSPACCYTPIGVAVDTKGNVYAADSHDTNVAIYATDGTLSVYAGLKTPYMGSVVDGPRLDARFVYPWGLAIDRAGNMYVTDRAANLVRKITFDGVVSTLAGAALVAGYADGVGSAALFSSPSGIAVDGAGNVYVVDSQNYRIRLVSPEGSVTTLAGSGSPGSADGVGTAASFRTGSGIAIDAFGSIILADGGNNKIRKVAPE